MGKIYIVSQDTRIPDELIYKNYQLLNVSEFIDLASTDDFELEEPIYYNIDSLDLNMYQSLQELRDEKFVKFYMFSDQSYNINFDIDEGVVNFAVVQEELEPEIVQSQEPVNEPTAQEISYEPVTEINNNSPELSGGIEIIEQNDSVSNTKVGLEDSDVFKLMENQYGNITNDNAQSTGKIAKVILFGSSKGGTGKTTTCLISVRRYAKTHPNERVALLDYDNVGQIGMTIVRVNPTLADYYRQYSMGNNTFPYLKNCALQNSHFSPNLDFYLAPSAAVIPKLLKDNGFWKNILELVLRNYDTVFFDTGGGLEYLNQQNIIDLYKIADKIILVSNTTSTSVNCVNAQIQYLSGSIKNDIYRPEEKITQRVGLVITRALEKNKEINNAVVRVFTAAELPQNNVPILAAFGNLDERIARSQYYQEWEAWDADEKSNIYLDNICKLDK